MMPNDVWHRKTSIFSSEDSILKEERERRRVLRIQQVRVQSKKIASQVIEKAKQLKKCEEHKRKTLKEKDLCDWKQNKLKDLQSELDHGLQTYGESHRAVKAELEALKNKKEKREENLRVANVRGAIAFDVDLAQREETQLLLDQQRTDRENLRFIENQRAKAIANLPPCIKPQAEEVKSSKSEGTRVEVYDFSLPQHRGQVHYTTIPDGVVRKIESKVCVVKAEEEAAREIAARKKKIQEGKSTTELITWLGNAAETRKILEKDFKSLFGSLKQLEQQELSTRHPEALTLSELKKLERRFLKKNEQVKKPTAKMADERNDTGSPQPMDFTEFPGTQFTPEEAGALGPTALSLQTLLDSLAGESRRRLEEVVGEDYYYCSDEDFATPPLSPNGALSISAEASISVSAPVDAIVSASSEISVSVKKHKKKKKKKSKRKYETVPDGAADPKQQQSFLSTNSTQYMSPPDRLHEDQIANYLANIAKEKEKLRRELDAKAAGVQAIDVPFYVNKLLAMTRESVENLSVSDVTESTLEVPSKKCKSSSSSSSGAGMDYSDMRDGVSNGQPSHTADASSFKDGSTAYLSLHDLKSKDPLESRVEPDPDTATLMKLISAPAEPLVRPMENLRLSTIIEADGSIASSAISPEDSQTLDLEAELLRRGLPLPPTSEALPSGNEYLKRLDALQRLSNSSDGQQPTRMFQSTPVTMDNTSDSASGQFPAALVSPILPSNDSDIVGRHLP